MTCDLEMVDTPKGFAQNMEILGRFVNKHDEVGLLFRALLII